jgi:DNA-binding protein HU-beta
MNKNELINTIAKATGIPTKDVKAVVEACFKIMEDSLTKGDRVVIRNFGSFSVRKRAARRARNMATQQMMEVPAHCVVNFEPSEILAERIRNHENILQLMNAGHDFKLRKASVDKSPPEGERKADTNE